MNDYKEFKIGDYIQKSDVYSIGGSSIYRNMARFCNENGLVMKESTIEGSSEYPAPIEVYVIAEVDPIEEEPVPESPVEPAPAPASNADIQRQLDEHTLILADLIGGRR